MLMRKKANQCVDNTSKINTGCLYLEHILLSQILVTGFVDIKGLPNRQFSLLRNLTVSDKQ